MDGCTRVKLREVGKETVKAQLCGDSLDRKLYEAVAPSTVAVEVSLGVEEGGVGTGFFVGAEGVSSRIVTNAHVVLAGDNIVVKHDNTKFQGRVLKIDEVKDLALVELTTPSSGVLAQGQALKLSNRAPVPGEPVWSLGHSGSSRSLVLSPGTVIQEGPRFKDPALLAEAKQVALDSESREASQRFIEQQVVSATVNVQPGSSGGPATNKAGELVFVTSMSHPSAAKDGTFYDSGVGANQVREFLKNEKSDYNIAYQWQSNLQYNPVKTVRNDLAIAGMSWVLPQLTMPLKSAYHGYNLLTAENNNRQWVDAAILTGSALAISKFSRPLGFALYGSGLALDACYDAFSRDNLVATKLKRTDGTERPPVGGVVLEAAYKLLEKNSPQAH